MDKLDLQEIVFDSTIKKEDCGHRYSYFSNNNGRRRCVRCGEIVEIKDYYSNPISKFQGKNVYPKIETE